MESIIEAENGDTKLKTAKQPEQLKADGLLEEAATIAEICAAIKKLVTAVGDSGGGETELQTDFNSITGEQTDELWRNVSKFASQLALARSSSLDDIIGKISIWRHLAPEQELESKFATIDETLLLSIIGDVERMHAGRAD